MSFPSQPFLEKDPAAGGTFANSVDACVCACPAPTLRFGFSSRTRVYNADTGHAGPFSEWSDYTFGAIGEWLGSEFPASNSNPDDGGSETQVRVQIEVGSGRAAVIRYRQIFAEDIGTPAETLLSFGELQTLEIPAGFIGGTTDFSFVPCEIGQTSFMVGGPGGGSLDAGFIPERQVAFLRKKGFRQYVGDSPDVVIFRKENVLSGGSPGCEELDLDPRVYSGSQEFEPVAPVPENGYLADPAGLYVNGLSPDLKEDHHATTPYLLPNESTNFGDVTYPTDNRKLMVETFQCGGSSEEKTLSLELLDEYTTEDMVAAVDIALNTQLDNETNISPADSRIVHRQWLCPQNVHYERVRTTKFSCGVGGVDTVLGGPNQIVVLTSTAHVFKRSLTSGSVSESMLSTSTIVQADDTPIAITGRAPVPPDEPNSPLDSPWEDTVNDASEILITQVTCKPNQLLCNLVPIAEDPAILALGFD